MHGPASETQAPPARDPIRLKSAARGPAGWRQVLSSFWMQYALAFVLVAFIGFTPTYWAPMAAGVRPYNPIVHIHAGLFFAWTLYYLWQSYLGASRQVLRHRNWGLLGVALVTALTISGPLVSLNVLIHAARVGYGPIAPAITIVPLSGIAAFGLLGALAFCTTQRPEAHRRFMLLTTIPALDAPFARVIRPAVDHVYRVYELGAPSPWLGVVLSFVAADVFLGWALLHEWRTRRRIHPVFAYGAVGLVALQYLRVPLSDTEGWQRLMQAFLRTTGVFPEVHP